MNLTTKQCTRLRKIFTQQFILDWHLFVNPVSREVCKLLKQEGLSCRHSPLTPGKSLAAVHCWPNKEDLLPAGPGDHTRPRKQNPDRAREAWAGHARHQRAVGRSLRGNSDKNFSLPQAQPPLAGSPPEEGRGLHLTPLPGTRSAARPRGRSRGREGRWAVAGSPRVAPARPAVAPRHQPGVKRWGSPGARLARRPPCSGPAAAAQRSARRRLRAAPAP